MKKIINLIYKKIKENVLINKNFKNKKRKNAYNNIEKVK